MIRSSKTLKVLPRHALLFANSVKDFNPLHIDAKAGQESIFRRCIIQGMFPIGWLAAAIQKGISEHKGLHISCGIKEFSVKFRKPIFLSDSVDLQLEMHWESKNFRLKVVKQEEVMCEVEGQLLEL